MTNNKIDIEKSISRNRIILKTSFLEYISAVFFLAVFLGSFPFIATIHFLRNSSSSDIVFPLLLIMLSYSFTLVLIYSLINNRNLNRISAESQNLTRENCKQVLTDLGWSISVDNKRLLVGNKGWGWTSFDWGKEVAIIYDGKDLLINSVAYGRHGLVSPFHWFANRKREKLIAKKILQQVNNR